MREFAEALYRHCEAANRAGLVRKPINNRFNSNRAATPNRENARRSSNRAPNPSSIATSRWATRRKWSVRKLV